MSSLLTSRGALAVLVLVLALGLSYLRPSPNSIDATVLRESIWVTRRVDLMLQLALMLAGALGIRAILPGPDEDAEQNDGME